MCNRSPLRVLLAALCLSLGVGCMSPTVTIATQEPIEIKIDLHHEVRIQLDREVSELIDTEGARALTTRSESADAERVRQGKQSGVFGERADGYLGVRSIAPAVDDAALVERVNASRRGDYQALADENELPQTEVEKVAGFNRIKAASPGERIQTPEGEWIMKDENTSVVVKDERDA